MSITSDKKEKTESLKSDSTCKGSKDIDMTYKSNEKQKRNRSNSSKEDFHSKNDKCNTSSSQGVHHTREHPYKEKGSDRSRLSEEVKRIPSFSSSKNSNEEIERINKSMLILKKREEEEVEASKRHLSDVQLEWVNTEKHMFKRNLNIKVDCSSAEKKNGMPQGEEMRFSDLQMLSPASDHIKDDEIDEKYVTYRSMQIIPEVSSVNASKNQSLKGSIVNSLNPQKPFGSELRIPTDKDIDVMSKEVGVAAPIRSSPNKSLIADTNTEPLDARRSPQLSPFKIATSQKNLDLSGSNLNSSRGHVTRKSESFRGPFRKLGSNEEEKSIKNRNSTFESGRSSLLKPVKVGQPRTTIYDLRKKDNENLKLLEEEFKQEDINEDDYLSETMSYRQPTNMSFVNQAKDFSLTQSVMNSTTHKDQKKFFDMRSSNMSEKSELTSICQSPGMFMQQKNSNQLSFTSLSNMGPLYPGDTANMKQWGGMIIPIPRQNTNARVSTAGPGSDTINYSTTSPMISDRWNNILNMPNNGSGTSSSASHPLRRDIVTGPIPSLNQPGQKNQLLMNSISTTDASYENSQIRTFNYGGNGVTSLRQSADYQDIEHEIRMHSKRNNGESSPLKEQNYALRMKLQACYEHMSKYDIQLKESQGQLKDKNKEILALKLKLVQTEQKLRESKVENADLRGRLNYILQVKLSQFPA